MNHSRRKLRKIKDFSYRLIHVIELMAKNNFLYKNQFDGLRRLINNENIIDISDTGSGKTLLGVVATLLAVKDGKVGVYLVPTTALRDMKYERIKNIISQVFSDKIQVIALETYLSSSLRRKPAIVIATYEKFCAEYTRIRVRKGFYNIKWLGALVVDEAHNLGDPVRGPILDMILRLIKLEQNPQFVFLSATFPNVRDWSKYFDLKLVKKNRIDSKMYGTVRILDEKQKQGALRHDLEDFFIGRHGYIAIVFCASREKVMMLKDLVKDLPYTTFSVHAGFGYRRNKEILEQIQKRQKDGENVIIFSTTILMPGIDLRRVGLIIFYNAEAKFFDGTVLKQGVGRSREKEVTVYFYFSSFSSITKKLEVEEDRTVYDFILSPVMSRISEREVKLAIMNYVAVATKPKTKIKDFLAAMRLEEYIPKLKKFLSNSLIFEDRGWVRLTRFGQQVLFAYIDPKIAEIIRNRRYIESSILDKIIYLRERFGGPQRIKREDYKAFLKEILETDKSYEDCAKKYFEEGDYEYERKTIAWLVTALMLVLGEELRYKETQQLYTLIKKTKTYPKPIRPKIFQRTLVKRDTYTDLSKKIIELTSIENPLSLNDLVDRLGAHKKTILNVIDKLAQKGALQKIYVNKHSSKRPIILIFSSNKEIPNFYFEQCKNCIFFERIPYHSITHSYCIFRRIIVSEKTTGCKDFIRREKNGFFTIENFPENCVICNEKLQDFMSLCPNCGSAYILKKNGKYEVIPRYHHKLRAVIRKNIIFDIPGKLKRRFPITIYADSQVKISKHYLYIKNSNERRGKFFDLRIIKCVILYRESLPDKVSLAFDLFNIPVYKKKPVEAISHEILRKKIKARRFSKDVQRDLTAVVVSGLLSHIVILHVMETCFNIPILSEAKRIIFSYIINLLFRYPNINAISAMAFEGAGKTITWNYLKQQLGTLIAPRVNSRFVPLYRASAVSPFHTVLNYLYKRLTANVRKLLNKIGFSYYYPGPGILHGRSSKTLNKECGLIFDIVDIFRPPFILATVTLFLENQEITNYFVRYRLPILGYAYSLDKPLRYLVDDIFDETFEQKVIFANESISLSNALSKTISSIRNWIEQKSAFPIFIYIPSSECHAMLKEQIIPITKTFHNVSPWIRIVNSIN